MENRDFSRIGKDIKDIVNHALEDGDFSGLNDAISKTVNGALKEVNRAIDQAINYKSADNWTGRSSDQGDWNNSRSHANKRRNQREWERNVRKEQRAQETMSGWRMSKNDTLYGKAPLKPGAILAIVFGSLAIAGFGIPTLVSLALGVGMTGFGIFQRLGLFFFLPLTLAGGAGLSIGVSSIKKRNRFRCYVRSIGTKTICAVKTLSRAVGKSERFVRNDLRKMIREGLFLQGHMDDEETCLMVTDETYEMYLQSKERTKKAREEDSRPAKEAEEESMESIDPKLQEAMEDGVRYMAIIRQVNDELPEPVISEKLDKLEKVIGLIFIRLQKTPEKLPSMKRFTDYYLPTTIKLVEAYREFEKGEIETDRIKASKAEIEQTLDTINLAFEQMLDSLYEEDTMDISTDIQVLQTLLAQEGYTDDGLHSMDDIFEGVSGVRKMQ
ncbi:MAG: 5-bromo-4-chloroindolyl phosphate hydrolysis family protein [Lachnospiraceae bacterium]|nr:5-bromo-4-chloroindolyl phosphate hydrolysis family protein [Lachnospiraceae bacterium]